jgi:hypothetical protein
MPRSVLPSEDCVFRLDSQYGFNQAFPMTFNNVGLSDDGFETGSVTAPFFEEPVFMYIEYDDTYLAEEYPDSQSIVTYTDGEITIDCSVNVIKCVDIYSRILTAHEIADRNNNVTFQFLNDVPTPTQQKYLDWQNSRVIGRSR